MREEVELEDTLSDVGCAHKVNFEQLGLKMTLIWTVSLESFKEECCSFLDSGEFEEDLKDAINRCLWIA